MPESQVFDGRVVVVTGAGRGIGTTYARDIAESGASVFLGDVDDTVAEVAEGLRANGLQAAHCVYDQSDPDSVQNLVDTVLNAEGRIDGLVNNASAFGNLERKPLLDIDIDEWNVVINVNLNGVFYVCRAVMPSMVEAGYGKIVNISSSSIFRTSNRLGHYVASKMGVIGLTRVIAREYGDHGIRVNAVCPGVTDSGAGLSTGEYVQARVADRSIPRVETPDDLAPTIRFLLSADSDFITGQTIVVDGGNIFL